MMLWIVLRIYGFIVKHLMHSGIFKRNATELQIEVDSEGNNIVRNKSCDRVCKTVCGVFVAVAVIGLVTVLLSIDMIEKTNNEPAHMIYKGPTNETGPKEYEEHITDEEGMNCLLPEEKILNTLSNNDILKLYDRYNDEIEQIPCKDKVRFGGEEEGKIVCFDKPYKPQKPCLVYSFGSNNQWDFENGVKKHFQCEQHTFDPSMTHLKPSQIHNPDGVMFHHYGVSNFNGRTKNGFDVKTFGTIRQLLNHTEREIDILKMDIESDEWKSLDDMLKSGVFKNVKQLLVEFHFWQPGRSGNWETRGQCLGVLRRLYLAGLRKFSRQRLGGYLGAVEVKLKDGRSMTTQAEMSFINIHF